MKSPWTKKNPWLSMYLSGANAIAGSLYGLTLSVARRQAATAMTTGMKQLTDAWLNVLSPPSARKRKARRR